MKRAFVLGHPITHSRSPLIHGHWLKTYGIDGSYEAIDVAPEDLPAFFDRIRAGEFVGGNVTVPHKEIAFALCDHRDEARAHIGAFNTLTAIEVDGVRLVEGTNTDYYGFLANLDAARTGLGRGAERAIVLGAGGAARGVLSALATRAIPAIHILNRTPEKARALADELPGPLYGGSLEDFAGAGPRGRPRRQHDDRRHARHALRTAGARPAAEERARHRHRLHAARNAAARRRRGC